MGGAGPRVRRDVTRRNIEYLIAIYKLGGKPGGCIVRVGDLAKLLNVSASTISIMIRRLEYKGLVRVTDGQGVCLTDEGLRTLTEYIWKHSVMELVLVKAGINPDMAKMLAQKIAPMLSQEDAWEIVKALGRPDRCPHGKLIPYPNTEIDPKKSYCGLD